MPEITATAKYTATVTLTASKQFKDFDTAHACYWVILVNSQLIESAFSWIRCCDSGAPCYPSEASTIQTLILRIEDEVSVDSDDFLDNPRYAPPEEERAAVNPDVLKDALREEADSRTIRFDSKLDTIFVALATIIKTLYDIDLEVRVDVTFDGLEDY